MTLENIKKMGYEESLILDPYIRTIQECMAQGKAIDLTFPVHLIPRLEKYCDNNNIPFYVVTKVTCSIAPTYSQLLTHEMER